MSTTTQTDQQKSERQQELTKAEHKIQPEPQYLNPRYRGKEFEMFSFLLICLGSEKLKDKVALITGETVVSDVLLQFTMQEKYVKTISSTMTQPLHTKPFNPTLAQFI